MTKDKALKLALEAIKDLLDQTETPPDKNCSCHIAPPCSDCVDYSGVRYAIEQANKAITAIKEVLAQPVQEPWLLESTQTLAKTLAREFYPEVTQWKCLNDLAGVISQIDNMTTGLMRKPKQEPLTDEQIVEIYTNWESKKGTSWADLMRAVEAAHDIKETKI